MIASPHACRRPPNHHGATSTARTIRVVVVHPYGYADRALVLRDCFWATEATAMRFLQWQQRRSRRQFFQCKPVLERFENRRMLAVDATLSLESQRIEGGSAHFDVSLDFRPTSGELLSLISLDVEASSLNLRINGTDFSAFSFTPASPLFDEWVETSNFSSTIDQSSVVLQDAVRAPLPAGLYSLGTLTVALPAAGLSPLDDFRVSINGRQTVIGVRSPDRAFRFEVVDIEPAAQSNQRFSIAAAEHVQEGTPFPLTIKMPHAGAGSLSVDWGDGSQESFDVATLPPLATAFHIYGDGEASAEISVTLITGTDTSTKKLRVRIGDVRPAVSLTGPSRVTAGEPYRLTLRGVIDPGNDDVERLVIDWGDGQISVYDASQLPPDGRFRHRFDQPGPANIRVDLQNEDGGFEAAGSLAVQVTAASGSSADASTLRLAEDAVDNALDVNRDGLLTPIDMLWVVNDINRHGARLGDEQSSHLDASGDGWISPDDVLLIVNAINAAPPAGSVARTTAVLQDNLDTLFAHSSLLGALTEDDFDSRVR